MAEEREDIWASFETVFAEYENWGIRSEGCSNATPLISAGCTSWRGKTDPNSSTSLEGSVTVLKFFFLYIYFMIKPNIYELTQISNIRELSAS